MNKTIKFICPLIVVADIKRSRHFYETVLNQKVTVDYGNNVTFEGNFSIHQKAHYKSLINDKPIEWGSNNFELYFEFDDLEKMEEQLKKAGVTFVHKAKTESWGQKVLRFYDPDNHIIEIGESMEHLSWRLYKEGHSVEDISSISMLPEDFIRNNIKKHNQSAFNQFAGF